MIISPTAKPLSDRKLINLKFAGSGIAHMHNKYRSSPPLQLSQLGLLSYLVGSGVPSALAVRPTLVDATT
jgi:hypothetical protein